MNGVKEIRSEKLMVRSTLPIESILAMKIDHKENEHGYLWLRAIIKEEEQERFLSSSFNHEKIQTFEFGEDEATPLFYGKIEKLVYQKQNQLLTAEIYGISYTSELDKEKKSRSFQNQESTYENVVEQLLIKSGARFIWEVEENRKIDALLIQYKETDWKFLIRIASHFHTILNVDLVTGRADFRLGMQIAKERKIDGLQILETGFSSVYYTEGSYEKGYSRRGNLFIKVKHRELWQMGDYIRYLDDCYVVYQREIIFENGELCYFYTLGTKGIIYKKRIFNELLSGLRLEGTIRRTEQESVFLQLDIDQEEGADYAWPWVPETGNLCYCMPEAGTKAVLYLPTNNEKEGVAVHIIRTSEDSGFCQNAVNKEFSTAYYKKLGLYPDQMLLEGKDGLARLFLEDKNGVQLKSGMKIHFSAQGDIHLNAENISLEAPQQVVFQNESSNIEICKNFNFYAPNGVRTEGQGSYSAKLEKEQNTGETGTEEPNHWQLSYTAMGAVPAMDLRKKNEDYNLNMSACGAVPKIAGGFAIVAMSEVMEGKKVEKTTFPQIFSSLGNYTVKGGFPISKVEKEN